MSASVNAPCSNCPNKNAESPSTPSPEPDPNSQPPVPSNLRPVPPSSAPCYMPQPEDAIPAIQDDKMGPIGPWATGRVDWSPLAGLTGTRPVVDKYSIARYSEGEWRRHNKEILDMAAREQHKMNLYYNFFFSYNEKDNLIITESNGMAANVCNKLPPTSTKPKKTTQNVFVKENKNFIAGNAKLKLK